MADQLDQLRAALAGRYQIERELGRGGMATVYLARDERHDRPVAIKLLLPDLAVSIGADRFLREIKVAAQLQHPNILGLYDSGDANGQLFYVMPFIEGESLRGRLDREKQLPIEDAVRLAREAAEALHHAHKNNIVHRDIKPENILLQNGHALVADFGIARALSAAGAEKLTQTGMAVGTPHYMSPEQALGGEVDGRSDLYSLGCVLYEMLIGQPPFDGPNATALIARHAMEAVPSLQIARPSVPDELEAIVHTALEKTQADRFPSCQAFADALGDVDMSMVTRRTTARAIPRRTAQMPVVEAPPPPPPRRGLAIGLGVAAAATVAVGAALVLRGGGGPSSAAKGADVRKVAVLYLDNRGDSTLTALADGLSEDLMRELGTVQGLEVISRNGVAAYRGDAVPRDSVARALRVGTLVTGEVEPAGTQKVRVTVRLVDASGADFKRASFEQAAKDPIALRDTLTSRVALFLRERIGEEVKVREQLAGTRDPEAWALVQRAERLRKDVTTLAAADTTGRAEARFAEVDSLLQLAAARDAKWSTPVSLRAGLSYARAYARRRSPSDLKPFAERAIVLADSALAVEPSDADALEARGNARALIFVRRAEADPTRAKQLLVDAQADLERATKLSPTQAGAWSTLAYLYNLLPDKSQTDVLLAARNAYEKDAYLANAAAILDRLFLATYDLDQPTDAERWCAEGVRRFANDWHFQSCQLWLMTMRGQKPDIAKAWKIAARLDSLVPADIRELQQRRARLAVAGALARASLADSARALARRSAKASAEIDATRDLAYIEAFILNLTGDKAGALNSLKVYVASNAERKHALATDAGWWFRNLETDPEFVALVKG